MLKKNNSRRRTNRRTSVRRFSPPVLLHHLKWEYGELEARFPLSQFHPHDLQHTRVRVPFRLEASINALHVIYLLSLQLQQHYLPWVRLVAAVWSKSKYLSNSISPMVNTNHLNTSQCTGSLHCMWFTCKSCLPINSTHMFWNLIRTTTASCSTKSKPYVII